MIELVPSYLKKLTRAEKHLGDLKEEFDRYSGRHPYEVTTTIQRQRKVRRLEFTEFPENTDIGIIAADVIYNLRSGLDHLACALVPAAERSHVMFPIFWQGVWEDPVPGENEQRTKDRSRWNIYTRRMHPDAVAYLRRMQPHADAQEDDPTIHFLSVLNRLSNTDRHSKFPLMVTALKNPKVTWRDAGGRPREGHDPRTDDPAVGMNNHAEFRGVPDDATDVEIVGRPIVVVRVSQPKGEFELVEMLEKGIPQIREMAVAPLIRHLHVPRRRR
ncbi:MAG: hypothetical protein ABSC00_10765 [Acidimicrobiales bacterium]